MSNYCRFTVIVDNNCSIQRSCHHKQIYWTEMVCFFSHVHVVVLSSLLSCRLEAPPAEHRLWQLPGKWSVSSHRVRHWWQAEGEDGGGVSPHEEPVVRAAGQLHGLHHVSENLKFVLILRRFWRFSSACRKQTSTFSVLLWYHQF